MRDDLDDADRDPCDGAMFSACVAACGIIGFALVGFIAVFVKACS